MSASTGLASEQVSLALLRGYRSLEVMEWWPARHIGPPGFPHFCAHLVDHPNASDPPLVFPLLVRLAKDEFEQARINQLMTIFAFLPENAHLVEGVRSEPNYLFAFSSSGVIIVNVELETLLCRLFRYTKRVSDV